MSDDVDYTAADALMREAPAFRKAVLKKIAEHEEMLRGKIFAEFCGHPEWKNACHCCGEVEIPVGAVNCPGCECKSILSIPRLKYP